MTEQSCYRLRRSPGAERFAAAWDAAIVESTRRLIDIAFDRAANGIDEPILDREGRVIYMKNRTNDRLLMFLQCAHAPGTYAAATPWNRTQDPLVQATQPTTAGFAQALVALEPIAPENPLRLNSPEAPESSNAPARTRSEN